MPSLQRLWPAGAVLLLAVTAAVFRPLLPIDETRYMTVAWEMRLHQGWLSPLTLNFEPYHHKPPLLFWLINLSWGLFGVSRWAALIPVAGAGLAVLYLTAQLALKLGFTQPEDRQRTMLLTLGSLPFLIYGTLVMFDVTLTMFTLAALLCLIDHARKRTLGSLVLMALCMGAGMLTKGPVACLYIVFPYLLVPLWIENFSNTKQWYLHGVAALLLSLCPVALWIIPVLSQADNHFAFWLVWEQTAGRVTGSFRAAHVRPPYFYLPLVPLFFMPWIGFPAFWRGLRELKHADPAVRFVACAVLPVLLVFSLISGKQPHYLVPLLPPAIIFVMLVLRQMEIKKIRRATLVMLAGIILAQGVAAATIFPRYDLSPVAAELQKYPDRPVAFVQNYHGEIGFLGRRQTPVTDIPLSAVPQWFADHPQGLAVIRYKDKQDVAAFHQMMAQPYRSKSIGIFEAGRP